MTTGWRRGWALAATALVAACSATGPDDGFLARKLSWFSYLNGDPLREACAAGAPDRYRLVYNTDYTEEVRSYDVTVAPDGGALMVVRVLPAANLARVDGDLLGPWRGQRTEVRLGPAQLATLVGGLRSAGVFKPPPVGLRLASDQVYWLINGCHAGQWFLTGFLYPSPGFEGLAFVPVLAALDTGGGPPPDPATAIRQWHRVVHRWNNDDQAGFFTVQIGSQGLIGPTRLFGPAPAGIAADAGRPGLP